MAAVKCVNHEAEPFFNILQTARFMLTLYVLLRWVETTLLGMQSVGSSVYPPDDRRLNMKQLCVDN